MIGSGNVKTARQRARDLRISKGIRNDRIVSLRRAGATMPAIATEMGLDRSRIRQILVQWVRRGGATRDLWDAIRVAPHSY